MGVPVAAKMRATESSVPSPPRTITSSGATGGISARSTIGAAGYNVAALVIEQRIVSVLAQPRDQFRQYPAKFFLLRLADDCDASHAVSV